MFATNAFLDLYHVLGYWERKSILHGVLLIFYELDEVPIMIIISYHIISSRRVKFGSNTMGMKAEVYHYAAYSSAIMYVLHCIWRGGVKQ